MFAGKRISISTFFSENEALVWKERKKGRRDGRTAQHKAALYVAALLGGSGKKNAGWNLDSCLEIEHDPCWGMIARIFLPTRAHRSTPPSTSRTDKLGESRK